MTRNFLTPHSERANTHVLAVAAVRGRPGESVQDHVGRRVRPGHTETVGGDIVALQVQGVGDGFCGRKQTLETD